MTNSTYVGRIGSTRALAQIFTVTACYQCFPIVRLKVLVTSFECFGVCRFTAATIAAHPAGKISSAEADDLPSDLICFVATSNDKKL